MAGGGRGDGGGGGAWVRRRWQGRAGVYQEQTFSWYFVPLFAHALGQGHLYPDFPANELPVSGWLPLIQAALAADGQYHTWAAVADPAQPTYIPADTQQAMVDVLYAADVTLGVAIEQHGNDLVEQAVHLLDPTAQLLGGGGGGIAPAQGPAQEGASPPRRRRRTSGGAGPATPATDARPAAGNMLDAHTPPDQVMQPYDGAQAPATRAQRALNMSV